MRQAATTGPPRGLMLKHLAGAALSLLPRTSLLSPPPLSGTRRLLSRMQPAVVRCLPGEPKLTISFTLDGSNKQMLRDQSEELGKVLSRIANGVAKSQAKAKRMRRNKGKQQQEEQEVEEEQQLTAVKLFYDGTEVAHSVPNSEAWLEGSVLQVGDVRFSVQRNSPTLTLAELPGSMLAGYPVCPHLQVEFGNLQDCEFTWYKENTPDAR